MMKKATLIIGLIIILIIFFLPDSFSQDWPQWRGINRDCKVTGFKVPSSWPSDLKQNWKISVGTGDATPLLQDGKLYVFTRQDADEVIRCLDAVSGKELWQSKYGAAPVAGPSASQHAGPRSTPAISNGKIVTFGVGGVLSCFSITDGKQLWQKENTSNAVPQFFTGMSPLITDNICIAHIGNKENGEVIALDLNTGNEKWKWSGDGPAYSSPSIMNFEGKKHIIVQTEKNLIALDLSDGKLLWKIATPLQQRFYNCVSPYIDGHVIYYTGQGTGMKAIKVEKSGNNYTTTELWSNAEIGAKWNTPVLKDGFLYGFTDTRKIYCLNAATGKAGWLDVNNNSDFATLLDCGSVLIGLPNTGNLIVFKPEPETYTEIAKYKVADTPVFTFPVVAGNNIFIKDTESLISYTLR